MKNNKDSSIIALDKFIQATRDSGYKGTYSAISELVDNALQASAKHVRVKVFSTADDIRYPIQLAVLFHPHAADRQANLQSRHLDSNTPLAQCGHTQCSSRSWLTPDGCSPDERKYRRDT